MPRRLLPVLLTLIAVPALLAAGPGMARQDPLQAGTKTVNVELILDASGSMAEALPEGETRMDAAKRILREVIQGLPERPDVNVGLRVYGHRGDNTEAQKAISCRASELLVPVAGLDKAALIAQVEAMQPTGWTPIAYSLQQAAADFQPGGESISNAIVLVTDGEETCDPPEQACQAAGALRQSDVTVITHVVPFALTPQQTETVRCIAVEGGGQLFSAANAAQLSGALTSAIAAAGVIEPPDPLTPVPAPSPLADVRSFAYHQITAWPVAANDRGDEAPILSDDGQRIAFARAPGVQSDPANPNRIFVVNADGSGEQEVDAYSPLCGCGAMIDISGNGSRLVSSDSMQLRVADTTGGGGRELLALDSNELNAVRISSDGGTIVFRIYRDTSIRNTSPSTPIERGIYAINPDGSDLRQVVGADNLAPILGASADQIQFFGASSGVDVSANGAQLIFAATVPNSGGEELFTSAFDGSGLRRLVEASNLTANAISGDGTRAAYVAYTGTTGLQEAGVIAVDGSGQRTLTDSTSLHPGTGANLPSGERIQLSMDGSRLLLGSTGTLYDTGSGQALALGVGSPGGPSDVAPLVIDGLLRATMDAAVTRVLYLFQPLGQPYQLVRIDLNPTDLGGAPAISDPSVNPAYVLTESRSTATVSARVSSSNPGLWVSNRVLNNGLPDANIYTTQLVDDGASNGDATAQDGLFTSNGIVTDCCAAVGPRSARIKAETRAADGRQQATAIDISPFQVSTTPAEGGPAPATATVLPPQPPTVTPPPSVIPTAPPTALPQACGPVTFPLGDISFADAVVAYEPIITPDNLPAENIRDPQQALGPPNYVAGTDFAGQAVTLGNGGRITLQFLDNIILSDQTAAPDLWVAEVGTELEDTLVEVSVDGSTWLPAGKVSGGTCGVDLDALGFGPETRFAFVRLTDDPTAGDPPDSFTNIAPGADIDAVGAISTGPAVSQPVTPPVTPPINPPVTPLVSPPAPPALTPVVTPVVTPGISSPGQNPNGQATISAQATSLADQAARIATLEAQSGQTPTIVIPPTTTIPPPLTPAPPLPPTLPPGPGATQQAGAGPTFVTPDPAECAIAPRTADDLAALAAAPDQAAADALAKASLDPALTIPEGAPADATVTAAIEATYRQMIACFNAGNDLAAYAFWMDDALRQIQVDPPAAGAPTPVPASERSAFRVTDVRVLPDGRVAVAWEERNPMFTITLVQILERPADQYLIAETVDVAIAATAASTVTPPGPGTAAVPTGTVPPTSVPPSPPSPPTATTCALAPGLATATECAPGPAPTQPGPTEIPPAQTTTSGIACDVAFVGPLIITASGTFEGFDVDSGGSGDDGVVITEGASREGPITLTTEDSLTILFADDPLRGDGSPVADLWLCGVPSAGDRAIVAAVSVDGTTWVDVGPVPAGDSAIDLDAAGFGPDVAVPFLRLSLNSVSVPLSLRSVF